MIILRHITLDRTPLDEWSARRNDLYVTTHNTHKRQTSVQPVGLEPSKRAAADPRLIPRGHRDRLLKGEDFKTGQVLCIVKCADGFVLLTKQETVLLGVTDRLWSHLGRNCVLKFVIAGEIERTRILGRRRKQLLDDLQEKRMGKRTRVFYIYIYIYI